MALVTGHWQAIRIQAAIGPEADAAFFALRPEKYNLYRQRGRLWFDDKGRVVAVQLQHLSRGVNLRGVPRDAAAEIAPHFRKAGYEVINDGPRSDSGSKQSR